MTVRWKPLLVLSGLFAFIAVVGVIAMAFTLIPRGSAEILPRARSERKSGQFGEAEIRYKQALQVDGKNPAIHEEMAAFYAEWAARSPVEKRPLLDSQRLTTLAQAAKYGKTLKGPRRQLLDAAMAQDELPESLHWAKSLLTLEPENADAHYVLASNLLEDDSTAALDDDAKNDAENLTHVLPEVKRHLTVLEQAKAPEVRVTWLKARLARASGDTAAREAALARSRALALPAVANPVDRMALFRLRALDVETTAAVPPLAARVNVLQVEAKALVSGPYIASNRVMRLNLHLERVQKSLARTASLASRDEKPAISALIDSVDKDIDAIFQQALGAVSKTDLQVYLTYADHLRYRGKRERCLDVVGQALKSPLAASLSSAEAVMGLHAVAVEAALADGNDLKRFETSAPHIKELIGSNLPKYQGLGHLFQGAIELEQSGVVGTPAKEGGVARSVQPKLRASALNHLKIAAAQLPKVVEAQARYGVALILSQELSLGRQYLQNALRQGETDPQYKVWAAWSMVQAGYPEEAEPVVNYLLDGLEKGRVPRELEGTLHLLSGEIHQARRSPDELKKALAEYDRSYSGNVPPAAVQLRMAQIEVQLGQTGNALKRLEQLRARGQGGPAVEHLAVLTLQEDAKPDQARDVLAEARRRYPDSDELVGLEAALLARDKKPEEADKVLAGYLERVPDNVGVVLMRAQVLADLLDNPKAARSLLTSVADRSDNSAPLVQLALLDLRQKDYDAVPPTIAKIRSRWKEAAAADLLDAQLALEQGNLSDADAHFDAALKKDPGNKMVQFWKAQIDNRLGASNEAAKAFETLAREGSSKQLDSGLSLATAAKSALANLALQNNDLDGAIRRFESLREAGSLTGLARGDRWQLVSAYAAKGQWPAARKEIASLLNDPKSPATNDERVRAANFYRLNKEDAAAVTQLDYVLGNDPAQASAVVTRAYMLSALKQPGEAIALLQKAIGVSGKAKAPVVFYLMLAALENDTPPELDASARALTALERGLDAHPKAPELVQAKYRLLAFTQGPKAAVAYVESEANDDDPKGVMDRMLAGVYRDQNNLLAAEKILRGLITKNPKEPGLAATLLRVVSVQAVQAGEKNDRDGERSRNEKAAVMIKEYRAKFPNELVFLEEDCDLAFRRGDVARATAVTNEIDQVARNSPVGPLLRARIFAAQGRTRDVADSYAEALRRNPGQADVRLLLGQTNLRLGDADEAIRQAKLVLDSDQDRNEALLLEARALAQPVSSPTQTAARRSQAVGLLNEAIKRKPKFTAGYHQIAEIQLMSGQRDAAASTLRAALTASPDDVVGLSQLVELLAAPSGSSGTPAADKLAAAELLAANVAGRDEKGNLILALAVGFHKAGQLELARGWAEKALKKLDAPAVHLNYGDILLSIAEQMSEGASGPVFRQAVEQYDSVLKTQANSVEAVNNKAWILYRYLGENQKALELVQALLSRVDPSTLPGEFFDTLGAIQEAVGRPRDAEESYSKGLRKSPDNPALNFHMGKLLVVTDARRPGKAIDFLEKARAGRRRLTPSMAAEVDSLMDKVRRN